MHRRILLSVFLATIALQSSAQAECTGVMCSDVRIELMSVDSGELGSNDVWVRTSGTESALSCTPDSGINLKLSGTSASKKEVYALLLTAYAMEKPVTIRVISGSADCRIAYVWVTG